MSKYQDAAHRHKYSFDEHPGNPVANSRSRACVQIGTLRNGLSKTEFSTFNSEIVGAFVVGSQEVGRAEAAAPAGTSDCVSSLPGQGQLPSSREQDSRRRVGAQQRPAISVNPRSRARVASLATYSHASSALNAPGVDNLSPDADWRTAVSRVHWRRAGPRTARPTAGQVFSVDARTPESADTIESDNVYYVK